MKYFNLFAIFFGGIPMLFGIYGFVSGDQWAGLAYFLFGAWMFWWFVKEK